MNQNDKNKLRDKRQKNGKLVPIFNSVFTCYHEQTKKTISKFEKTLTKEK